MQPSSRNEQLAVVLLHCCPGGPSSGRDGLRVPPPVTHAAESLPRQFCGGLHIDHDAGHALTVGRRHALTVRANSTVAAADNRSTGVLTATPLLYSTPPRGKIATAGGAVKTFSTYIKRPACGRPPRGRPRPLLAYRRCPSGLRAFRPPSAETSYRSSTPRTPA